MLLLSDIIVRITRGGTNGNVEQFNADDCDHHTWVHGRSATDVQLATPIELRLSLYHAIIFALKRPPTVLTGEYCTVLRLPSCSYTERGPCHVFTPASTFLPCSYSSHLSHTLLLCRTTPAVSPSSTLSALSSTVL